MKLIIVILALLVILSSCDTPRVRHISSCKFGPPYYLALNGKGEQIIVPTKDCVEYDYYCGTDLELDEKNGCNIGDWK